MRWASWMICLLALAPARAMQPADLTYLTEDYPPENFVKDGVLQGYSVDLLKAIWRKMAVPEQPIRVLPWARGYSMALNRKRIMLFAMAKTPERENRFRWVGPFYRTNVSLVAPKGRTVKAKSLAEARRLRIAAIRDDIGVECLKNHHFPDSAVHLVNSLEQGVRMLEAGRVDLLCSNPGSLPPGYRSVWIVGEIKSYYALSRDVDPKLVARFQSALESLGDERRVILKRYQAFE